MIQTDMPVQEACRTGCCWAGGVWASRGLLAVNRRMLGKTPANCTSLKHANQEVRDLGEKHSSVSKQGKILLKIPSLSACSPPRTRNCSKKAQKFRVHHFGVGHPRRHFRQISADHDSVKVRY